MPLPDRLDAAAKLELGPAATQHDLYLSSCGHLIGHEAAQQRPAASKLAAAGMTPEQNRDDIRLQRSGRSPAIGQCRLKPHINRGIALSGDNEWSVRATQPPQGHTLLIQP